MKKIIVMGLVNLVIFFGICGVVRGVNDPNAPGREPTAAEKAAIEAAFPELVGTDWRIVGEADGTYNCIGSAVGENEWYNKSDIDGQFGDNDGIYEKSDFDDFMDAKGYEPTDSEADADVVYYDKYHAAGKNQETGGFESKLGSEVKITHDPDDLTGDTYGEIEQNYKRK